MALSFAEFSTVSLTDFETDLRRQCDSRAESIPAAMFSFVPFVFALLAVLANGIIIGEVEVPGGESRCGIVDTLLWNIRYAQQAQSPQDAANRIVALTDTYQWSEFCVQGKCTTSMGDLIQQFSRESRVVQDMTYTNLRSEYGRAWAQSTMTISVVDRCGVANQPINAVFSFYCNGEQGRATAIHVVYDEVPFIVMQRKLKECEERMEQEAIARQISAQQAMNEPQLGATSNIRPLPAKPDDEEEEFMTELDDSNVLPAAQTPEPISIEN